jgi:short-subunit dehydrogenase
MAWGRALVTGASEGIGEAFARELAARGTALVVVARRADRLRGLAKELSGVDVEVLPADLVTEAGLEAVESRLADDGAPIDLLVNNAGGASQHAPFLELEHDTLTADAYLNTLSLLRLTHSAARAMAERGGGHVINVSAGIAFYPLPGAASYGAAKAFVNSLSEALAYELREAGVRVTAVCPGFTHTGAQARLGLRADRVPRMLWREPDQVARLALRAAARGRPLVSPGAIGALNAFAGRHLPRRMWVPQVARSQAKLAGL